MSYIVLILEVSKNQLCWAHIADADMHKSLHAGDNALQNIIKL